MKTIDVGKMCKISEFDNNDSEYVLDVIALTVSSTIVAIPISKSVQNSILIIFLI